MGEYTITCKCVSFLQALPVAVLDLAVHTWHLLCHLDYSYRVRDVPLCKILNLFHVWKTSCKHVLSTLEHLLAAYSFQSLRSQTCLFLDVFVQNTSINKWHCCKMKSQLLPSLHGHMKYTTIAGLKHIHLSCDNYSLVQTEFLHFLASSVHVSWHFCCVTSAYHAISAHEYFVSSRRLADHISTVSASS